MFNSFRASFRNKSKKNPVLRQISAPIAILEKKLNLDNITFIKSAASCLNLNEQLIESFYKHLIARILENKAPERNKVRYKGLGYIAYISEVFFNSVPKIEINITNKQTQEVSFGVDIRGVKFKQSTPMTDIDKFVISEEGNGINARYFNISFPKVGSQEEHTVLKVNAVKLVLTPGLAKRRETFGYSEINESVTTEKNCEHSSSDEKLPRPTSMDWGIFKTEIHETIFHALKLSKREIEAMLRADSIKSKSLNDTEEQELNEITDIIIEQQQKLSETVFPNQYYDSYGFSLMASNPSNIENYRKSRVFQVGKGNINFFTRKASAYGKPTLESMQLKSEINSLAL